MFWSKAEDGLSCVEIAALLNLQDVFVEVGSVSTGDVINIGKHERALPVEAQRNDVLGILTEALANVR